jgi:phospholipid/cholesterol/gamma-HCH transport system permease protein
VIQDAAKAAAREVQEYLRLVAAAFRALLSPPWYRYDIVEQFDAIGAQSLTVVALTGLFTGAVRALQGGFLLDQFGGGQSSAGS